MKLWNVTKKRIIYRMKWLPVRPHSCVRAETVQIQAWKALKWVAFDSLVFVFMAQDQSQVALKLTLGGALTLCLIAEQNPEERSSSLM